MRIVKQEKAPCFTKNVVWVHFRKKKLVAEIFDRGKWRDLVNNDIDFELSNDPNTFLNGDGKFTNIALLLSDNEDLSAYNENGVVKLKFNNRKPSNTGSKGYVILRKNKTINDQILEDNTIYEIRYDFDLNGDNIQLPNNVVLRFNGGSFKNGTVFGTGLAADGDIRNTVNAKVFSKGVNLNTADSFTASNIGMVSGENGSGFNDEILDSVLSRKAKLVLDGKYYFTKNHVISNDLTISGGTILLKSNLFENIEQGVSVSFIDINICSTEQILIEKKEELDYLIGDIIFENCVIEDCSIIRLYGADVPYQTTPHGLRSFVVKNCYINTSLTLAVLNDLCVSDKFLFSGNIVKNMQYSLINLGETNEFSNTGDKVEYWADIIFSNNNITGVVSKNNTSYNTTIIADGQNKLFFNNNIISDIITTNESGVAYECYASVNEYYFTNNLCKNIVHLPSSGNEQSTWPEMFKSKSSGTVRHASNNEWIIDFNECREICKDAGVLWTDEKFSQISFISLFGFVDKINELRFDNNIIKVLNGSLILRSSSAPIVKSYFRNNIMLIDKVKQPSVLLPDWNKDVKLIHILNNNIYSKDEMFYLTRTPSKETQNPNCQISVCGNIFNKFPSITGTGNVVINNNHYYESIYNSLSSVCYFDVQTKDEISTYVTFPEINGTIKIYDNVYASIDIQHRFSDGSLTIYYSNVTIDTDVIFNLQNEIKYYRFVNSDGKINLIDNYGNIVMDNGRYDKIYENERLQIACKISSDNKEKFFYITFKKPMLINLRTAPSNIGIIKTIIENKYNIGEYKFDKTLKKPLWWNGAAWVDANGVAQ